MSIRLIPILLVVLTIASCTSATLLPPPTATPAPPTPTATPAPPTPTAIPASPITYEDMRVGFIQSGTAGKVVMRAFLKTNQDIQGVLAQDYEVGLGTSLNYY